ncbi:MAG: ornithine cyclodeaminase family protein [Deltaproteobacteria bacterium]|nr:ornithine cyclodeaminase family protein [Deltaproteobacteria bacterium]
MLFLNKDTIQKAGQGIIQTAVEQAYQLVLNKQYNMPDRMHVADSQNTLLLMPCFSEKFFATKLVSVFPEARLHGQAVVNGVMVLFNNISGQPLAIMDGAAVTAHRTGAVGGLGVKFLSSGSVSTAGIFGAGVQGISQARYLLFNRKIKTLYLCALHRESAIKMSRILKKEYPGVEYVIPDHPAQLIENSAVIIAATTSTAPLFQTSRDCILGKTFISIGSFRPGMQEFPDTVIKNADDVFVDTMFAAKESGDIAIPLKNHVVKKEKIKEFAGLLENNNYSENKTVLFKSVGMALFDLTVASAIYEFALEQNIGQTLDF